MNRAAPRVIPCLLLKDGGLVKGVRFKQHEYVGDPMNAIKIYNDMEVDELLFLDVDASVTGEEPDIELIERLAEECYMPFGVGGGIRTVDQIRKIIYAGAEKVVINSALAKDLRLLREASDQFGRQALMASLDVRKKFFGSYVCFSHSGTRKLSVDPVERARELEAAGAGELLLTSIDQDGTMEGYDIEIIQRVSEAVRIPVIASGGAGNLSHLKEAVLAGASAVAAGSLFVYHSRERAVLINYPQRSDIQALSELS